MASSAHLVGQQHDPFKASAAATVQAAGDVTRRRVVCALLPCRGPASRACSPAATASTKSAKRKAAEALLAAQYGGLSANSSLAAAACGFRRAGYTSDAAAEAGAARVASTPSSKRTKGLCAAITRLGGEPHAVVTQVVADAEQQQRQDQRERQQQQQRGVREVAGSSWQQSAAAADTVALHDDLQLHLHSDDSAVGGGNLGGHVECAEAAGAVKQQQQQGSLRHSQQQQQPVVVPACGPECAHTHSNGWCHSQVGSCWRHMPVTHGVCACCGWGSMHGCAGKAELGASLCALRPVLAHT